MWPGCESTSAACGADWDCAPCGPSPCYAKSRTPNCRSYVYVLWPVCAAQAPPPRISVSLRSCAVSARARSSALAQHPHTRHARSGRSHPTSPSRLLTLLRPPCHTPSSPGADPRRPCLPQKDAPCSPTILVGRPEAPVAASRRRRRGARARPDGCAACSLLRLDGGEPRALEQEVLRHLPDGRREARGARRGGG